MRSPFRKVVRVSQSNASSAHSESGKKSGSSKTLRRALIGTAAGAGLLAAGYVGAAYAVQDKVADGTRVAGVEVGGLTQQQATEKVAKNAKFPGKDTAATVKVGAEDMTFKPGAAWRINAVASTKDLTGFSLSPKTLAQRVFGGGHDVRTGVFTTDQKVIATQVAHAAASELPGAAKPGTVKFIAGKVYYTPGTPGFTVDENAVAAQLVKTFPKQTSFTASASTVKQSPLEAELATFAKTDAAHAMSAPLKVMANGDSVSVPVDVVSEAISTKIVQGKPTFAVNPESIMAYVMQHQTGMKVAPVDAKVIWTNGKPSVAPAKNGEKVDANAMHKLIGPALAGDHELKLPMTDEAPAVQASDIDVSKLPSTSMAHFVSPLPGGAENASRTKNITVAINTLNGQYIKPGQQFSLLRALGYDFNESRGYVKAGVIQGGIHTDGMGGGVSQVSTTVYNTAFFAGVQLDEHTSHAFYLSRYPEGREATIWNPAIDNKWTNDTGHPILIKAQVKDDAVVMDFYGTKKYEVQTHKGPRTNLLNPKVKTITDRKGCENTKGKGTDGFQVDVFRDLLQNGTVVHSQKIHVTYQPDDIVRCVNTSKPDNDKGTVTGGNVLKDNQKASTKVTKIK